ncbi:MAG: outer membrane protein assembly factor BamE [Gammaproteobacteria bacterium]|nr:outer membrane protein assembly factor BamE [Gammaproteobacteria bacterium]
MQKLLIILVVCATLAMGCAIHKPEIQQGNVVKPEMLAQLKIGMTSRQVRFIMGSPLLTDPFHPNRWDYIFTLNNAETPADRKHLILYFDNDQLSRIDTGPAT